MKKTYFLCSVLFTVLLSIAACGQTPNHPTIEKIKVGYRPAASGTLSPVSPASGKPEIKVLPDVSITLKNTANVSKVYLKIMNKTDNNVIYQVNYNISSQSVTNALGIKLFFRDNALIHIGDPNIINLDTYKYQVITEDAQGNQSVEFIAIQ